jgi:hypothetical protein
MAAAGVAGIALGAACSDSIRIGEIDPEVVVLGPAVFDGTVLEVPVSFYDRDGGDSITWTSSWSTGGAFTTMSPGAVLDGGGPTGMPADTVVPAMLRWDLAADGVDVDTEVTIRVSIDDVDGASLDLGPMRPSAAEPAAAATDP